MFDTINGLPLHPLVVHAVVVLLPLSVLGTIALVLRPAWRARYGLLLVAVTAAATTLIPVATQSGEALEHRVGDPGQHAHLGDQLIWFALPLLALTVALAFLPRLRRPTPRSVTTVVSALALVAALATAVQVYRVGDSGAHAVWSQVPAASNHG